VEVVCNNFKAIIHEEIKIYVPHNILIKNSYLEYYNREVKCLKLKVRKAYNRSYDSSTMGSYKAIKTVISQEKCIRVFF
jgi:hypothetical protein